MLTTSERFKAAQTLVGEGQWEEAEYLLDEILAAKPDHSGALNARGAAYLKAGDYEKGERLIRQAALLDPEDPAILGNLSSLAQMNGDIEQAICHAEHAHRVADNPAFHARQLGVVYLAQGRLEEAEAILTDALKVQPDDVELLAAMAETDLARGEPSRALVCLERALGLKPDDIAALIAMARLQSVLDAPEAAIDYAKKAFLAAPRNPLAAMMLAGALQQAGQLRAAAETVERLLKLQPKFEPAHVLLARIRIDRGEIGPALAGMAKWVREAPSKTQALLMLADIMATAGSWKELIALSGSLAGQAGEMETFRPLHINALLATGRLEEAWELVLSGPDKANLPERTAMHACQISPGYDPKSALVLARAAVEWSAEKEVHLSCPAVLAPAFQRLGDPDRMKIEIDTGPLPPEETPVLSTIAAHLWTGRDSMPFEPYLRCGKDGLARWQGALAEFPKPWIGVYWNEGFPGLTIEAMKTALEDAPGTRISLQFDKARHQLRVWPGTIDAGVAIEDLADLVDLVGSLDRVVGPNGWPMHIAGALGKPGTILLPENHDWYWHGEGETSSWYPSVTRILKPAGPDWESAVSALAEKLREEGIV